MGVAAVERSLSDAGNPGNLVHADGINTMLGEEVLGNIQNALAMLRCIAPFMAYV
jgi:hypothetical protein